jgi:hypothetical protein
MKKMMGMMLAACMVAGFSLAQVTSLNVVGYCTVSLTNGYNMLAVNLGPVGNPNGTIDINSLLPTGQVAVAAAGLTANQAPAVSDQVMVWNATSSTYSNYFLYKKAIGTSAKNYQWCVNDSPANTYPLATYGFSSGDGLWFILYGQKTSITVAGQVPNNVSKTKTLVHGYNMIGSGFSADWSLNAIGTNFWAGSSFTAAQAPATADQVMIYNSVAKTYSTYFLYKKSIGTSTKNYQWCLNDSPANTYPVMTNTIPMPAAVFFILYKAGPVNFAPQIPYSL